MTSHAIRNRQAEAAECGLASLAMCASLLGSIADLPLLRQHFPSSSRGVSLADLSEIARTLDLSTRAVRCEPYELRDLRRPAILHWAMDHFVVLDRVDRGRIRIFDPAHGFVWVRNSEVNKKFTGVALEVFRSEAFKKRRERSPLQLASLVVWSSPLKGALAQALLLSFLMQAYVVASPFYMQLAIDESALKGDVDLLTALAVGFGALAIFNAGADTLRSIALQRVSSLLNWEMTQRLFHHMVRLPLPWFERRRLADALSRFQSLEPVKGLIANGLVAALVDGLLSIITLVMMFVFAPSLGAVAAAGFAIYATLRLAGIPYTRQLSANSLQASIAEQSKRIDTLRAIQTIKVMAGEARRESDWANKMAHVIKTTQSAAIANIAFSSIQHLVDGLLTIIVIYLGVGAIIKNELTVGTLYAFMAYRGQFMARGVALFEQIVNWRMLDVYTFRLSDVVLTPVETDIDRPPIGLPTMVGYLELDRLSFRYSPTDQFIIRDANLRVEAGEFVALTGVSGSGKSTLLKLACGLYPPTAGEIRVDNLPVRLWGPRGMRDNLGVVMQDDQLLPGSIADNVSFFDEERDLVWIWECLRMAAIADEVRAMPMRLDSFVGDMGAALSGGQRQRLLLARALYKRPKILVLDEATSHLDIGKEVEITSALKALKLTRLVVAHRLETLQAADRRYVVRGGQCYEIQ